MGPVRRWRIDDDVMRLLASLDAGTTAGFVAASLGIKERKAERVLEQLTEDGALRNSNGLYAVKQGPKPGGSRDRA